MNKDMQSQVTDQEEKEPEETIELLEGYKRHFSGLHDYFKSRAERIEMLQKRRSAQKWNKKKKDKMQRRHAFAVSAAFEVEQFLDQVNMRLEQRAQHDPWINAEG